MESVICWIGIVAFADASHFWDEEDVGRVHDGVKD